MRRLPALCVVLLAAGCFSPRLDLCGVTCTAESGCPGSMVCQAGSCGGAGCQGADATTPETDGVPRADGAACGGPKLSSLVDSFDGVTIDAGLWAVTASAECRVEAAGEELRFAGMAGVCGVRSVRADYCLHDDSLSVELTDAGDADEAGTPPEPDLPLTIRVAASEENWIEVSTSPGSQLSARISTAGTITDISPAREFNELDRLAISARAGKLHIELKPPLGTWTDLWEPFDEPAWTSAVYVELTAAGFSGGDDSTVDDLNVPPR